MQALYCFVFSVVGVNHLTVGGCEKADFKELNNHVNEANTKKIYGRTRTKIIEKNSNVLLD